MKDKMLTVTKKNLMELENYGEYEAKRIIQEAKLKLVERNFEFYANPKLGRVPAYIVEEIIGFNIFEKRGTNSSL